MRTKILFHANHARDKRFCRERNAGKIRRICNRRQRNLFMTLIVASDSALRKNEAAVINALFDEGLEVFHLRKPFTSAEETEQLLQQIDNTQVSKIALHQHHQLANMFGIKRLHYPEAKRKTAG